MLFYCNGISAFLVTDQDNLLYSFAGKVILKNTSTHKENVGYIINESTILTESGITIKLDDVYLPEYVREEGCWNYCGNDDNKTYIIMEYDPIQIKICDSGNCQILASRVVLSQDKTKIILNK